jgi:acetyl esterase/lipase
MTNSTPLWSFVMSIVRLMAIVCLLIVACPLSAQEKKKGSGGYPPNLPGAKVLQYKAVGDVKLSLYLYEPQGHEASDNRPAIVFFFGGGWTGGSPGQFEQQCKYLASRGMVAITADYRVASRHNVKAISCVADAKSAIRFVRQNAAELGIDPDRIAAAGGSAGGHLAACTGVIAGLDEPGEDTSISSVPNALVLFNPALVLAPVEGVGEVAPAKKNRADFADRMGTDPEKLSPYHHVKKGAPPTIIFHGRADSTVPFASAAALNKAMEKAGNRCTLVGYDGQAHGFFNYGRGDGEYYTTTVRAMDEFLASLGYLTGKPTIGAGGRNTNQR